MNKYALAAMLALSACAEYRTDYRLEPPASDSGHACVAQCDHQKAACHTRADASAPDAYQRCQERAEASYTSCQGGTTSEQEKKRCYRPVCAVVPSYDDCDALYRSCFTDCGGEVWSRHECVNHC